MAPSETLVTEPRTNRWHRRMAPVLILLGLLLALVTPGLLNDLDAGADSTGWGVVAQVDESMKF
jgi:hypothetical protein